MTAVIAPIELAARVARVAAAIDLAAAWLAAVTAANELTARLAAVTAASGGCALAWSAYPIDAAVLFMTFTLAEPGRCSVSRHTQPLARSVGWPPSVLLVAGR